MSNRDFASRAEADSPLAMCPDDERSRPRGYIDQRDVGGGGQTRDNPAGLRVNSAWSLYYAGSDLTIGHYCSRTFVNMDVDLNTREFSLERYPKRARALKRLA